MSFAVAREASTIAMRPIGKQNDAMGGCPKAGSSRPGTARAQEKHSGRT